MGCKINRDIMPLIISVLLMTIAIYFRDFTGAHINKYLYLLIAVGTAIVLDYSSLIYYLFFLVSLRSGLPETYIFPILIIIIILKKPSSIKKGMLFCFLMLVAMELLHYPFYNFDIRWNKVIGIFSYLFLTIYLVQNTDKNISCCKCLLFYCIGLVVFMFGIYVLTFFVGGTDFIAGQIYRIGGTKTVTDIDESILMLNENPNVVGWFSLSGIASTLVMYRCNFIKLIYFILLTSLFLIVGALTISRTWIMCVVILTLLYIMLGFNIRERKSKKMIFGVIIFFFIGVYIFLQNDFVISMFEMRMTDDTIRSGGSRTGLLQDYNNYLLENPLILFLGTGAVHYFDVVSSTVVNGARVEHAIHNGIQQIFVSYGLIGFIFWLKILFIGINKNYQKGKKICWLPFIISFIFVQSCQLINPPYLLFIFIASFIALRLSREFV